MSRHADTLNEEMAGSTSIDMNVRNWAMLAHLLAIPGLWIPGLPLAGPVLVWVFRRDVHDFVEQNAVRAFNFQAAASVLLLVACLPLLSLLYPLLALADAGIAMWAAWRTRNGETFTYPFSIPFLR